MSSSADDFGWSAFRERPVPPEVELLSPAAELAAVLQRCSRDLDAAREATRQATASGVAMVAEHAVLVFQLAAVLGRTEEALTAAGLTNVHRQLRIVNKQMVDALKDADLVIVDPLGKPFDETADVVEVTGWRHGAEFGADVVAETIEPVVFHGDAVVRHGRVIMGAPLPEPHGDEETA
jgi:hypothetical protein